MTDLAYDEAAHLARRMGFGSPPDEVNHLASLGREQAVDFMINFDQIANSQLDNVIKGGFDFSNPNDPSKFNRAELERWWFTRMIYTARPFEEKMTLFWHNHFATAASKVPDLLMYIQNQTLRANSLARFDDLLLKVAQDPAMLVWLDGVTSVRGLPNENFARELQELFTLGITDLVTGQANYSEEDVKEIARAFTGWKFYIPNPAQPLDVVFFVNPPDHDNGSKTIYGTTANFGGEDVVAAIAARVSTARFLVKKLFSQFVYPLDGGAADLATIDKFAQVYMSQGHSIKELVRAIFTSDEFFSDRARFGLVKSPVEFIVGAIRMLGANYKPGLSSSDSGAEIPAIFSIISGQELFNPPNVAGWPGGLTWINTAWLLNRYTFADILAANRIANPPPAGIWMDQDRLRKFAKGNTRKTVNGLISILGPLTLGDPVVANLRKYLTTDDQGNQVPYTPDDGTIDKKIRGLLHQMLCLSEFQLN
jgi:uncharacterized protein (DUF1800 family)